jgi:hypothetical protein
MACMIEVEKNNAVIRRFAASCGLLVEAVPGFLFSGPNAIRKDVSHVQSGIA